MRHENPYISGNDPEKITSYKQSQREVKPPDEKYILSLIQRETALVDALRAADLPTDEETCERILMSSEEFKATGLSPMHAIEISKLLKATSH